MCLAIPGKLIRIDKELDEIFRIGVVDFEGVEKEASLRALPEAKIGDYVMVHAGVAISIIDEEEAQKTMEVLKNMEELGDLQY